MKHLHSQVEGQRAHGGHDVAGRTDRTSYDDFAIRHFVSDLTAEFCAELIELKHPRLGVVQFEPAGIAAESIGQK